MMRKIEVAMHLGLSVRAVERLIAAGKLLKLKEGRAARVPESAVRGYIDGLKRKAGA